MAVADDMPRKKQNCKVKIPVILKDYVLELMIPGQMLIRLKTEPGPTDTMTLESRLF